MDINRANLNLLFTGFQTSFQNAFAGAPQDYAQIVLPVPSTKATEVYPWLGQTTGFREWIGDRVIQNLESHDFSIKNRKFENTVKVNRDDIEDDAFGLYSPLFAQLGQDAAVHPGLLAWGLLLQGFSSQCYDGQNFFDTDHRVGKAGSEISVSNSQGGSGAPWFLIDTSRMIKPIILQKRRPYNLTSLDRLTDQNVFMQDEFIYGVDARLNVGFGLWQLAYASREALDGNAFNDAYASMASCPGDNGLPLGTLPRLLVCGPRNRAAALEAVKADRNQYGATNINKDAVDVLVTPWLP